MILSKSGRHLGLSITESMSKKYEHAPIHSLETFSISQQFLIFPPDVYMNKARTDVI